MMRVIRTYGIVIKQKNFNIKSVDTFLLQFYEYKNMTFLIAFQAAAGFCV